MPKKTVWEMTAFQRLHHSLGGKTFRAVVSLSLVISLAAVAFGFFLYSASVNREYRAMTWQMSVTAAELVDREEVRREAEAVIGVYDGMTPEERLRRGEAEYFQRFAAVETDAFQRFRELIHGICVKNNAVASYTAFLDLENRRMVFIADGDPEDTFCPPGDWDLMAQKELDAFMNGAKVSVLDALYGASSMNAVVTRMERYGYRCTAGTQLLTVGKYPVFLFFDTDMNRVAEISRDFLLQYVVLLLLVTALAAFFFLRHLKKTVVQPINDLARAARAYTTDPRDEHRSGAHFAHLDIRTGDEIENLSLTMKAMEADLADYVRNLARVTAEKERIGAELDIASQIQTGMLPNIYPAFPDRPEFDIYATMTPAKEVGGDFYDFFLIDDDHLGLVMADVSGKGVPAALFMMASKILINNFSSIDQTSPAHILERMNAAICKHNPAEMFITVWLGILEISTGRLKAANAGHEYPCVRRAGGRYELYKDRHGFVVGGLNGVQYKDYDLTLAPGDALFVYTDGLPEATDGENTLFGTERMLAALNAVPDARTVETLRTVHDAVDAFVMEAPQFDDLTMMCLYYSGPKEGEKPVREITVEARVENLAAVTDFVDGELEAMDCPLKAQTQIDLAVDELFSNIARYAYGPEGGTATVRVETEEPRAVLLTFLDSGVPYDPLAREDPDTTLPAEEREIGGLGVFLVKKTMDELTYEYKDGRNILRVKKYL